MPNENSYSPFYSSFLSLCSERGVTPSAAARDSGISSGAPTAWKNGAVPKPNQREKLCNYFGVSDDVLLGYSQTEKAPIPEDEYLKEENEHFASLNDLYYKAVKTWSKDIFFSADETIIIQAHFSGVLLRYKSLIEDVSRAKMELKTYLKAIAPLNDEKLAPLSNQELAERFLKEKLQTAIDDLNHYIDSFILYFSRIVEKEKLANQVPTSEIDKQREEWEVENYRNRLLAGQAELEKSQADGSSPSSADGETA